MRVRHNALLLVATASLAGCRSGGSSSSPPPPPTPIAGHSYSPYMPMQPGDRYECDSGLVLRVEPATETNLGTSSAVRIIIEDGGEVFGVYWSEVPGLGTLHHGAFDLTSGRQVVLPTPEPIFHGGGIRANRAAVLEYDAIGAASSARQGATVLSSDDPSAGTLAPQLYSHGSIYGTVYPARLLLTRWRFVHHGVEGNYLREFQLRSNPGYGPLTIAVGEQEHTVVRAVLNGKVYD